MSLLHFILFLFVSLYGPVSLAEKDCEAEEHLVIQNISTGMFGQLLNHKLESAHQLNPSCVKESVLYGSTIASYSVRVILCFFSNCDNVLP